MSLSKIDYLSIKDCAKNCGLSENMIYKLVNNNKLTKIGTIIIKDDKYLKLKEFYKKKKELSNEIPTKN